uniref:NADH-ubiquinone oxidoreductase chain 2 n=1 Tax=Notonecta montandoni TaxID=2707887 RepID=A0A6C0R377_9HEMI|nr:NADH dehydrogenase subunit 2 [Notonecta montandoni]QHZ87280.1 NADH dehydrogenase subunit 2 [Notonecta montandoni]
MTKNSSKLLFFTTMIIGTMMVMSSNNWLSMWMGLEINMISFIPLMSKSKNNLSSESMMLYFLVQSMGSVLFLMMIISNSTIMISPTMINDIINIVMTSSLLLKVGAAPFHFWLPEIMEKMNWVSCMIIMTWQKLAPLIILSMMLDTNNFIMIIAITSTTVGAVGGLNQTSMRKIMAYSSISHLGWMLSCMKFENEMWMNYLMIYAIIVVMTTMVFNYYSMFYLNQMTLNSNSMMEKIMYSSLMLSMGGLPPFLGFLPKWMVIQAMMSKSLYLVLTIMVLTTLVTLFYYLRMISTIIMINSTMSKWSLKIKNQNKLVQIMLMFINTMLPMVMTLNLF